MAADDLEHYSRLLTYQSLAAALIGFGDSRNSTFEHVTS